MFRFLLQFCVIYAIVIACFVSSECTFDSPSENEFKSNLRDLEELTKKEPIVIKSDNYTYTIGICTPVKGTAIGVIQTDDQHGNNHNLGFINKAHIQSGSDWMLLEYEGGDAYSSHCTKEGRQSHIMIMCDENNSILGGQQVLEENNARSNDCYYLFEITSSIACSINMTSSKTALSLGSILIILFICIAFVYLAGGFIYQRFIIGAKGSEQFPNIAFWKDFGNLVADGCDLAFRTHPKTESRSYKGIGDDQLGLDEDEEQDDHLLPM